MEIYDKTSDIITSGSGKKSSNKKAKGKIRKGAMMAILDVSHPDVEEFIRAKQTPGRLTKFNVSVNMTDNFMWKLLRIKEIDEMLERAIVPRTKKNEEGTHWIDDIDDNLPLEGSAKRRLREEREEQDKWYLRFPETTDEHYKEEWDGDLKGWEEKGYKVKVYKTASVTGIWNAVMESTYARAEPGVIFIDRGNHFNPLSYAEKIIASNPCGEQLLSPGNICTLGTLNLTQFVLPDGSGFNMEKIRKYIRYLVRFLDNVNTYSNAPLKEYKDSMTKKRRIGIGVMGWGSALYMMKIRFGSIDADNIRDELMQTVARESYMGSIDLAEEKGMFEYCIPEKHAKGAFIQGLDLPEEYMLRIKNIGIRNASLLSCQPNGNTGIFANVVSGGIEPVFSPEYTRTVIVGEMPDEIAEVTPLWYEGEWYETDLFKFTKEGDEEILRGEYDGIVYKIDKNRGLTKEVLCQDYGVRWLDERDEWDREADWAIGASELTAKEHLSDLKGFARWVDSSLSKTINVPYEYKFEDFKNIYTEAYSSGYIKGLTTYRAGTMTSVLTPVEEKFAEAGDEEIILEDVKVPTKAPALVSTIRAEGKKWYLTTIMDEGQNRPIAFFVHTNHHEKSPQTKNAVDHLLNLAERKGIPSKWIEDTVNKMGGDSNATKIARCISLNLRHGVLIKNVVAALSDVEDVFVGTFLFQIRKHLMTWIKDGEKVQNGHCPECSAKDSFVFSEGCMKCSQCGYSKCG
jgi:ribonucleoside-diphosphate reductase alpha chain